MKKLSRRLLLEQLEDRCLLSTYGVAWPGANKITVSFAPDGTLVDTVPSALFQNLNGQSAAKVWEMEILRALQSWAVTANINLGVMPDHGQALGSAGPIKGSTEFGDIRLALRALGPDVLALNTPYDPVAGTRAGDIVFNSAFSLGVNGQGQFDLFSLALHETGNALGLGDTSTDSTSALYSIYHGVRTGPSQSDKALLQALYGARTPDRYEGAAGNNSLATATTFKVPEVAADLTALGDVDFFRYKVPDYANRTLTITVRTAGLSLLTSRLTVFNAGGQVVATAAAADPLSGDASLRLDNVTRGTILYFKVEGARTDVFGVGGYRLKINSGAVSAAQIQVIDAALDHAALNNVVDDHHTNDTRATATNLNQATYQLDPRFNYAINASLNDLTDLDYYKVVAPAASASGPKAMLVSVTRTGTSTLDPEITIYDASGNEAPAQVLANDDGSFLIQVTGATPGATYYVCIDADPFDTVTANQTGNYLLGINFQDNPIVLQTYAGGVLNQSKRVDVFTLQVNQSGTMHLVLSATTGTLGATAQVAVRMNIYDFNGVLVASLIAQDGQVVSKDVFLTQGRYVMRIVAATRDQSPLPDTCYLLRGRPLTDPEDPPPIDPTLDPTQVPPPPPDPLVVTTDPPPPTLPPLDPSSDPWTPLV